MNKEIEKKQEKCMSSTESGINTNTNANKVKEGTTTETTSTMLIKIRTNEQKRQEDTRLRRALYNLEDGLIQQEQFDAVCNEIESQISTSKDAIIDLTHIAPEILKSIVPNKDHLIYKLYKSSNCTLSYH